LVFSAPSALNLFVFLLARLDQRLYQRSSAFITGAFDLLHPKSQKIHYT
jgi:hypothetical protein